jgi:alkanesulfonate monooxygenase SsuD/methylene tetrahydromethanopterin reductase-like flavin-dependent oxidoreductase (luciferase family)
VVRVLERTARPRPLRFGVVTPVGDDVAAWRDQVRALADTGYSTILMPDVPGWQPAPVPTLAVAATLTEARVGTWVAASPVRPAWTTAWEAHSLTVLTEGRFELGIGTGRPGIADMLEELGLPASPMADRAAGIRRTIQVLRELDGPEHHTPVVMAVGGPKSAAVAAELADGVNFVMPHVESRADTAARVAAFDNARGLELALHVPAVGEAVAAFMAGPDLDVAAVRAADSVSWLPDDPAAATEAILRCREELGFSYVVLGAEPARPLAAAVAALAGT